jgi:hypothetical protein
MFARKVFVLLLNWRKYCAVAGVGLLVPIQSKYVTSSHCPLFQPFILAPVDEAFQKSCYSLT